MKRTPTRPWEIRNERARIAWIDRGRVRWSAYPNGWRTQRYTATVLTPPQLPLRMAPLPDDLRKVYDEIRQETNRLMGLYPRTAAAQHDLDVLLSRELSLMRVVGDDT